MPTSDQLSVAARAIRDGFEKGVPFLKFGEGDSAVILCQRRAGEEIDYPGCEDIRVALEDGVFKRYVKMSGEEKSFVFLGVAPFSPNDVYFAHLLDDLDHWSMEAVPFDVAYQVMQFEAAQTRQAAREAFRAARNVGI